MLVLTRKIGEEIIIDGRIRVTITQIKGDKVRLGIEAPPEVAVDRQEVHERRKQFAAPDAVVTDRPAPTSTAPKVLQPR
jgi:carbon storage regulator